MVKSLIILHSLETNRSALHEVVQYYQTQSQQSNGLQLKFFRNFYGKDSIIKLLNAMGELNMNQLHLRISDDEGWRIQILELPELTNIGANRCYDPNVSHFIKYYDM